jgi:hypothetical protein
MKQLSGQDNSFLEIEGIGIPQHISSVAIYDQSTAPDGAVRFKDVLCHLKSRLHLSPIKDSLEGATINDVMLTIVTGALHKYLKAAGEILTNPWELSWDEVTASDMVTLDQETRTSSTSVATHDTTLRTRPPPRHRATGSSGGRTGESCRYNW